ncbi:MAG TPA: trypsin-like serine protease, partial [Pseudobdellovibrionaceae bacterium]|nr:trypsin-like serine protease [Pseudobdellovibrionaceae bacterium]
REPGRGQGSGTLVASDLVLTAAHCVVNFSTGENLEASGLTVYFGDYDGQNWNESLAVRGDALLRHPNYDPSNVEAEPTKNVHDIALLKLSRPAPETFVPARALLTPELRAGQPLLLAGFGNMYFMNDPKEPKSRLLRVFE